MPSKSILSSIWSSPISIPGASEPAAVAPPAAIPTPLHVLETGDVFIAGGRPNVTLVDRSHTPAFAAISAKVRRRGRVISLHGESKSGKTILCLQIFGDRHPIQIHAQEAKTLTDFWSTLRYKLSLPYRTTTIASTASHKKIEGSIEGSIETGLLGTKATAKTTIAALGRLTSEGGQRHDYDPVSNGQIIDRLLGEDAVIIIDDFHWITEDVQTQILRDLRPFLLQNGTLVVVSVPERAEQILANDHEMSALCTVVEAPRWELEDIFAIGRKGFASLNLMVDAQHVRKLAGISHHNPMLMQEACHQLCCHFGVLQREKELRSLIITSDDLRKVFKATAKQQARPQYKTLAEGSAQKSWRTNAGKSVTIYTLCLLGMRHIGFKQEIGLDKLVERIAKIIGFRGKAPDRGTVKRALQQLSGDMVKALGDNAPMEYDGKTERVYFLDPFFMTYIQWVLAPEMGEPEPDVG